MTGDNVVENQSARKGTVKINVSQRIKDELLQIQDDEEHTSMDSVIRELLRRPKTSHYPTVDELRNLER